MLSSWRVVHPGAKNLVSMLSSLSNVADEAELRFTERGLEIRALDPAKIALMEILIPSSAFIEYDVSAELRVGINLSSLIKILPRPKKGDRITLSANEEFHEFIIEGSIRSRYKFRNIEVALVEIPEINVEYDVHALILSRALSEAIKELEDSEGIEFTVESPDYILMKALGLNAQVKLSKVGGSVLELSISKPSKNTYDSDYLSKIDDALAVSEVTELSYGSDTPLFLYFKLVDETIVKYLLAPKS